MTPPPALTLGTPPQSIRPRSLLTLRRLLDASGLRTVMIGHSKDPNAKLTILLISPTSANAVFAVKAPTTDIAEQAVQAEMRMLLALRGLCPPGLEKTIPCVVDLVEFEGRSALITTAVAGTPMTTSYLRWRHTAHRPRVAADFAAAGAWLTRLHQATAVECAPLEMGAEIVPCLRARFAGENGLEEALTLVATLHARLRSNIVRRSAVHGDFWIGNVLLSDGAASGVVDWEAGAISGESVRDLVRFALMYALYLDRNTRARHRVAGHPGLRAGVWGAGIEYALDGKGWFPNLFRGFLSDGLRRLGASPLSWRDVALAGIAEVAALTDDPEFARRHLELFRRLSHTNTPTIGTP